MGAYTRLRAALIVLGCGFSPLVATAEAQGPRAPNQWLGRPVAAAGPSAGTTGQEVTPQDTMEDEGGLTFLGTAKWASLAISAGAAAYGFSLNSQADDIFAQLDDICLDEPSRCESRNPDDSFTDESLESLYQRTLSKDRQARAALIVSQVTLGAAVLFFIMDLSNRSPPNIPFDPSVALEAGPGPGGSYVLAARVRLGN